jgi:16S rRNA (adenine1518-N6/adenine1519-N6)-dimethyltransferase
MSLTNKSEIKRLLKKYNAKPEKYLGQHFLLSKNALAKMIGAADIKPSDTIIEIGPGLGTLTKKLAETGAKIIAVEKDPLMVSILKETLADYKNIQIIQADAREVIEVGLQSGRYKIVANLPYNIATFLIHSWLEAKNPPKMMVLMIQKEAAQRIAAKPSHSNLLAISVQFYADAKIIDYVKKELFWPKPKVDSAIIKIVPKKKRQRKMREAFFAATKAGFSQPRKQLLNNLSKKLGVPKEKLISIFKNLGISERARAENLSINQWLKLTSELIHN